MSQNLLTLITTDQPVTAGELLDLPLACIVPDPAQPRRDPGDLEGLCASLHQAGLIQPVIVQKVGENAYQMIAGERRYAAARRLGWTTLPAIVRSVGQHCLLQHQLLENMHRKDLTPFEEAGGYRRLMQEFGWTQETLGKQMGKSQESVSEALTLLRLPAVIQQEYRTSNKISRSVLVEIARLPTEEAMLLQWNQACQGKLTVRQVRRHRQRAKIKPVQVPPVAGRKDMMFRYPIATEEATVTVCFDKPSATFEEVVQALEEALHEEKKRLYE